MSDLIAFDLQLQNQEPVIASFNSIASNKEENLSKVLNIFDVNKYSSWFKLLRIVARWLQFIQYQTKQAIEPMTKMIAKAKKLILLNMMPETKKMLAAKKCKELMTIKDK